VARHPEGAFFRGWLGIDDTADAVLAGPWPRWHGDVITLPPGAEVLARDAGTVQAFALPNAIGVQFHPEATPAIMRGWAERSPQSGIDPVALHAESEHLFAAQRAARELLFAELVSRSGV
jgi:GMP synthase-like glutamine amidotransferase